MSKTNDFSVERAMQVVMRHKNTYDASQPHDSAIQLDYTEITEEVLKYCLRKTAHIIQQDDTYLTIFKRLKTELEDLRQQNELKEYAKKIALDEIGF